MVRTKWRAADTMSVARFCFAMACNVLKWFVWHSGARQRGGLYTIWDMPLGFVECHDAGIGQAIEVLDVLPLGTTMQGIGGTTR